MYLGSISFYSFIYLLFNYLKESFVSFFVLLAVVVYKLFQSILIYVYFYPARLKRNSIKATSSDCFGLRFALAKKI